MLITNPDLINSCRVCRSPNQDGDYECLYQNNGGGQQHEDGPQLSEAGMLYENLLDISLNMGDYYPQFLCNSCDLQMKLFKKLKDKAYKTLEYLQNLYEEQLSSNKLNTEQREEEETPEAGESVEDYGSIENDEYVNITSEYEEKTPEEFALITANEYEPTNIDELPENETKEYQETAALEYPEGLPESETKEYQETASLEYPETQTSEYQDSVNSEYQNNLTDHYLEENSQQESEITHENPLYSPEQFTETLNQADHHIETNEAPLSIESLAKQFKLEIEQPPTITDIKYRFSAEEIMENPNNSQETIPQIRLDLEPIIDKTDYVTEIYELLDDDESKQETLNENVMEYDVYTEEKTDEDSCTFGDVEYVIEEELGEDDDDDQKELELKTINRGKRRRLNNTSRRKNVEAGERKKREYKCVPCQLEFKNLQEHKQHRIEVHDNKFPCSICTRELKSLPALHQHMKLHNEQPAYQCDVCQKTFNQKAHYQYHMNRHNNIRNYKCSECEKSFIAKTDLKVHMRTHTGQRPYVCNICGKDYLMMEHLKSHLLIHTEQYFQCDICQHKFATHKTLRMHVKTIHEDEPKFKCTFCSKPFRRKHHLEYHMKLHQKNVKLLDSHYEMVDADDPDAIINTVMDYNADDLVDQELVDDPGFIALNDDII